MTISAWPTAVLMSASAMRRFRHDAATTGG
jgi:hypothetical protein